VVAVPQSIVGELVPAEMSRAGGELSGLDHIRTSPITGVHFWFDREVMKEPYLALLDHTVQWIFNKTQLSTDGAASSKKGRSENAAQYLQLVISASYDLVPKSRQEIIDICLRDLADVLPTTIDAELTKATVIKEVHATFSPEPGIDEWRPAQRTSVQGLALAGDWTSTGWPSTMESAVRSGYLAAEALTECFGAPQKFLQPDLPFEGLSAFWARKAARSHS
jgi:uncharacterized protein with NAD-binding domain and iron-sulfur cluster